MVATCVSVGDVIFGKKHAIFIQFTFKHPVCVPSLLPSESLSSHSTCAHMRFAHAEGVACS